MAVIKRGHINKVAIWWSALQVDCYVMVRPRISLKSIDGNGAKNCRRT
jgi:hypothetical protein